MEKKQAMSPKAHGIKLTDIQVKQIFILKNKHAQPNDKKPSWAKYLRNNGFSNAKRQMTAAEDFGVRYVRFFRSLSLSL